MWVRAIGQLIYSVKTPSSTTMWANMRKWTPQTCSIVLECAARSWRAISPFSKSHRRAFWSLVQTMSCASSCRTRASQKAILLITWSEFDLPRTPKRYCKSISKTRTMSWIK
jgi:hypothetical protein